MSTNLIHVLTAIGESAAEIQAACDDLLGRRVEREPGCRCSEDWPPGDREAADRLCQTLIAAALDLPIVYHAAYVDGWNTADQRFHLLDWPDGATRHIYGDDHGLAYYPGAFRESLLAQIKTARRRKFYRDQREDRWYLDHIHDAIDSASWLRAPFLVVSISRFLGPSRYDEDIEAALGSRLLKPDPLNLRDAIRPSRKIR